ncbi:MAG: hypothetical protein K1X89_21295 [Myxococcaceae bacterium]|nr:hypothetical protein [Myxococcaceae bacterium]
MAAASFSACSSGGGGSGGGSGSSGGGSASSGGGSGSSGGGSASSGGGSGSSGGGSASSGGGSGSSGGGSASSGGGSGSSGGGSASSGGGSGSSGGGSASSGGGSASSGGGSGTGGGSGGGMMDAGQVCTTLDAGIAPDIAVTTVLTPSPIETGGTILPGTYLATAVIDHYPDGGHSGPDDIATERNIFILDSNLSGPYAAQTKYVDGGITYSVSTTYLVPGDGGVDSPVNAVFLGFTCPFNFGLPVFYTSDGGTISMTLDERQIVYTRQ